MLGSLKVINPLLSFAVYIARVTGLNPIISMLLLSMWTGAALAAGPDI